MVVFMLNLFLLIAGSSGAVPFGVLSDTCNSCRGIG